MMVGIYTITSISKAEMRGMPTLIDFAAIAIFVAQCIAETAYITVDTVSI